MNLIRRKSYLVFQELFLYACAWWVLVEWLFPLYEIAEMDQIAPFMFYSLLCFAITFLRFPVVIGIILKAMFGLAIIYYIHYAADFSVFQFLPEFIMELKYNIEILIGGDWTNLTDQFRIALIVVLIWLMSYLLHYWFVVVKRVALFLILTIIYIAVSHTFQSYDASFAVIRIVLVGIASLGMANALHTLEQEAVVVQEYRQLNNVYKGIGLLIIIVLFIGIISPVFAPQWADPVPKIKSAVEKLTGKEFAEKESKVGYSEDDSALGGSFIQDETPQFLVLAEQGQYWKIETKDEYTGKGWEASRSEESRWQNGTDIDFYEESSAVDHQKSEATFLYDKESEISRVTYPYWLSKIKESNDLRFKPDSINEKIELEQTKEKSEQINYTVEYESPSYSVASLLDTDESKLHPDKRYTQLPEDLPERVHELATEITESHDNKYEKVKAVEQYFNQSGFEYQTTDIPIPKGDTDYVDQFLFESQVGYCDNYSTSMVVLLRSVGIEARWAKGFTEGDVVNSQDVDGEAFNVYEVKSDNAHSWVEVYFPETGWVPFEPTQGFSNLAEFEQEKEENQKPAEENKESEEEQVEEDKQVDKQDENVAGENEEGTENQLLSLGNIIWFVIALIVIVGGLLIYRNWDRVTEMRLRKKFQQGVQAEAIYEQAYFILLKRLATKGHGKSGHQTLRAYATQIDQAYETTTMSELTELYEAYLYSDTELNQSHDVFVRLWEEMIQAIRA